jgi:hypothetical protein
MKRGKQAERGFFTEPEVRADRVLKQPHDSMGLSRRFYMNFSLTAYPPGEIFRARDRSGISFNRQSLLKLIGTDSPVRPGGTDAPKFL